ncbi:hypothetical protein PHLCEN_2v7653 [Hermanssonia centrifuga]|uniref:Cytochrome P450 n=1 Tax=Hermanssonia centrifuga TaxID=98765 RepID=A0A2R6NVW5_9APHY|nr:hypothetical protein PHLCEN_2v7653 [Hermanssonia centrifuga]
MTCDINEVAKSLSNAGAVGAYLVDIFPVMLYLPEWLAQWKREGRQLHEKYSAMLEGLLLDVRSRMQTGGLKPCLGASLIEAEGRNELSKRESAWLAGVMFVAGSETVRVRTIDHVNDLLNASVSQTASALSVLLLAMMLYPDVLKRGQDEIGIVVGTDRQPGFQDQNDLPYINAIVKEVLRWRPIAPLERFLGGNGEPAEFIPQTNTQNHFPFGSGRRICAGMNLAYQSLFINTAYLLWALNIRKPLDENGEPIVPSGTCIDEGIVV